MQMIDWIIVGLIGVSTLISLIRGFIREALSLVTWIAAFVIARLFGGQLAGLLTAQIDAPTMRLIVAFTLLFVGTLIVGAMINHLIGELVRMTGLTGTDRALGMVFGSLRGLVVLLVAVGLIRLTPMVEDDWWKESLLIPTLLKMEQKTRSMLFNAQVPAEEAA